MMAFFRQNCSLLKKCCLSISSKNSGIHGTTTSRVVNSTILPPSVVYRCFSGGISHHRVNYSQRAPDRTETTQGSKKTNSDQDIIEEPVKFSTSKAAFWSVDESFGKRHKKPLKVVIPVCVSAFLILAWAFLRSESEIDRQLEIPLTQRLPEKFSEAEVGQFRPLPDWTKPTEKKVVE